MARQDLTKRKPGRPRKPVNKTAESSQSALSDQTHAVVSPQNGGVKPKNGETIQDVDYITNAPKRQKDIPLESIIELRKKRLSTRAIAKLLDCDHSNIVRRLQGYKNEILGIESFKRNRSDIFAIVQARIINSITDDDIKKAPLGTKTLAVCQLYDKERLERGMGDASTAINNILITIHQALFTSKVEGNTHKQGMIEHDNDSFLPPNKAG